MKLRKDHIELVKFNASTDMDYRIVISQLKSMILPLRSGDGLKSPTDEDVVQAMEQVTLSESETANASDEEEKVEVMEEMGDVPEDPGKMAEEANKIAPQKKFDLANLKDLKERVNLKNLRTLSDKASGSASELTGKILSPKLKMGFGRKK